MLPVCVYYSTSFQEETIVSISGIPVFIRLIKEEQQQDQ